MNLNNIEWRAGQTEEKMSISIRKYTTKILWFIIDLVAKLLDLNIVRYGHILFIPRPSIEVYSEIAQKKGKEYII